MAYVFGDLNTQNGDLLKAMLGQIYHCRPSTALVTAANATDLNSAITLSADIRTKWAAHISDVLVASTGSGAHLSADTVNVCTQTVSSVFDLPQFTQAMLGALNGHYAQKGVHIAVDTVNTAQFPSTVDSGLAGQCQALNLIKGFFNAHIGSKFASAAAT